MSSHPENTARAATAADAPEIVRVVNSAYAVERPDFVGDRTDEADVLERLRRPGGGFLVVDASPGSDGHALAAAVFVEVHAERGYLGMLAVDPERQGQGIGAALVAAVERHCRESGCRHLALDVVHFRTELPPFYERLGFTEERRYPYPHPERTKRYIELILMSKTLG